MLIHEFRISNNMTNFPENMYWCYVIEDHLSSLIFCFWPNDLQHFSGRINGVGGKIVTLKGVCHIMHAIVQTPVSLSFPP
jgi:hypothetical protein